MTLAASALAGGDCIDDADVLRTGGTAGAVGCTLKAPSTLGTFLRSFRWGHVRQLDRVSRDPGDQGGGCGVGRTSSPMAVSECGCSFFSVSRKNAPGVACAHSHQRGRLVYRHMLRQ